jgi:hypothetical protein
LRDHLSSDADVARRLRDAQTVGELEVSWKITTGEEAAKEEAKLLRNYKVLNPAYTQKRGRKEMFDNFRTKTEHAPA